MADNRYTELEYENDIAAELASVGVNSHRHCVLLPEDAELLAVGLTGTDIIDAEEYDRQMFEDFNAAALAAASTAKISTPQ